MCKSGYVTTSDVASHYRVGLTTVRRWIRQGKLSAHRGPKIWWISQGDLVRFERDYLIASPTTKKR